MMKRSKRSIGPTRTIDEDEISIVSESSLGKMVQIPQAFLRAEPCKPNSLFPPVRSSSNSRLREQANECRLVTMAKRHHESYKPPLPLASFQPSDDAAIQSLSVRLPASYNTSLQPNYRKQPSKPVFRGTSATISSAAAGKFSEALKKIDSTTTCTTDSSLSPQRFGWKAHDKGKGKERRRGWLPRLPGSKKSTLIHI